MGLVAIEELSVLKRLANRLWHVVRFVLNLPWTLLACAWGKLFGGHLEMKAGLFVVSGGMRRGYSRGGTTIGNVFLTGRSETTGRLLSHETKHADQWAILPVVFPIAYGVAELIGRGPKGNVFERWAGLEDGGYL